MTIRKAPHNFCKNCGAETSPGQMLCASCSANLSSEAETGADSEEGKSFEISCPHCGETLMGNESIAGLTVECPCCSKKFIAPSTPAESSAPQMQETPQLQAGSSTSAPVGSQQKPDGRSVGKRRFRITRSQTPNYKLLNTSKKEQPAEQADATMDANSEDETSKGHPLSGLFNLFACALYVAAAALFALHSFAGIICSPNCLCSAGRIGPLPPSLPLEPFLTALQGRAVSSSNAFALQAWWFALQVTIMNLLHGANTGKWGYT